MSVADSKGTAVLAQCFTPGTVFSTARMTDNRVPQFNSLQATFSTMESHSESHCEAAASPAQQPRDTRWGRRRSLVFFVGGAVLGLVLLVRRH